MDNKIKTWLWDISKAIENIENFLPEKRVFTEFQKDLKTKYAVERNITIIGEAMNRILSVDENIPITSARKIVDTRNQFIHNYGKIDDDKVWNIVINHLPTLKTEIEKLLSENNT
jgi:uncharacterized protein with HEPN domain